MKVQFVQPDGSELNIEIPMEGLVVGRDAGGADLELTGDANLSRRHGRLWRRGEEILYEDLGSSNGSWLGPSRIQSAVSLQADQEIVMGRTRLRLLPESRETRPTSELGEGMTVRLAGPARRESLSKLLARREQGSRYLSVLAELIQKLVESDAQTGLSWVQKTLPEVMPEARRVAIVAWPFHRSGRLDYLLEPNEEGAPVSKSLARRAVERQEALLFSEDTPQNPAVMESVQMHGIRSAVYVPLMGDEDEVFGVLCVDNPSPTVPIDADGFHFVRSVGGLLASALKADKLRAEAIEKELEAKELEAHRRALVNFLNIASHDLKNPLTVVRVCARLLPKVEGEQVEDLSKRILDAERRAEELIASYLEVAEITSKKELKLACSEIDLAEMVKAEILFVTQARATPSTLSFEQEVKVRSVYADPQKLGQVLSNLVSNAVKYSPDGGTITVSARLERDNAILSVKDQGVGISASDQQKLFQQFQRVGDQSLAPGTGLGLWLSGALVHAHGGRIWVESEPGKGSTFSFSLPQPP